MSSKGYLSYSAANAKVLGLLFGAVSNIASHRFSVPFTGFQYHRGFSTRSHLHAFASCLMVIPGICQSHCINTNCLIHLAHLQTVSLPALCHQLTFRERSFSFIGATVWDSLPLDVHEVHSCIQTGSQNTAFQELLPIQVNSY